jgi:methionine synthase II (cobalamin-independent)
VISAWALVSLVPLIGSNLYALRKIVDLQRALNVKDILIDGDFDRGKIFEHFAGLGSNNTVSAGGTVVSTVSQLGIRIRVTSSRWTDLKIAVECV